MASTQLRTNGHAFMPPVWLLFFEKDVSCTHEHSDHISRFLRATIQHFNANIKMLFVLFVCLCLLWFEAREAPHPFSIQPVAVAQYRFYNRGKGQAFRDQTHLLIYSVYSISGLW